MAQTQTNKILSYLQEHKVATSNELRRTFFIVDVPKAISILVKEGFPITSKRNKDNTATYYLGELPKVKEQKYDWVGNTAYVRKDFKPKQTKLL